MPEYADLVQALFDAFDECGAPAVLTSPPNQRHPRRFVTQVGNDVVEIWVYIWTLTHGGGAKRPANEYRIQLTGIRQPPLQSNPTGGPTLLLGYEPNLKCFAGFDLRKPVTGIQLRLVEAAHILPVGAVASTDHTTNGLCLSPTFHRAYDRALIYLDESYVMRINPRQEEELMREGFVGGIEQFRAQLGKQIYLPSNRNEWPSLDMIHKANKFRQIPV